LIADTKFQLTQDEDQEYIWTFGSPKTDRTPEILKMLDNGMTEVIPCLYENSHIHS